MLDIQFIRDNPELVKEKSAQKNYPVDVDRLLTLDAERRSKLTQIDELRRRRNEQATELKQQRPTDAQIAAGRQLKEELATKEGELAILDDTYFALLKSVPNIPADDVPVGTTENDNVVTKQVGTIREFDFEPKSHWELGESRGFIDKERAAKVAGSRFAYLKGDLVQLHFALMNFAMSVLTDETKLKEIAAAADLQVSTKPYTLVMPPLMIKTELYDAMDRLEPRDDRYKIEGEELWLQGSAEHVLGSMHVDEIIPEADLPIRYAGYATSFRKEAGTYGKDMEGIIRLHQFEKLEMESLTTPEDSLNEHLLHIAIQEYLMQQLGLPYQVVMKCTADIGKPDARGVDIDTWFPAQQKYRETHTADHMTDYQSRRLKTRLKRADGSVELVHTNDATALAQRPMIAIMENYQTADGHIEIPAVLQPFMGGKSQI
ncbi:MAG: serS [Candidatus Saccharibacteria bacterium]|nr:serS [Candidatus Saccharibacteria bacterium]